VSKEQVHFNWDTAELDKAVFGASYHLGDSRAAVRGGHAQTSTDLRCDWSQSFVKVAPGGPGAWLSLTTFGSIYHLGDSRAAVQGTNLRRTLDVIGHTSRCVKSRSILIGTRLA
jgi:hypothetical protein